MMLPVLSSTDSDEWSTFSKETLQVWGFYRVNLALENITMGPQITTIMTVLIPH